MRDPIYIVVPKHVVSGASAAAENLDTAIRDAAALVEKDRTARVVLMVVAEAAPSPVPRVDVERYGVPVPEVGHG